MREDSLRKQAPSPNKNRSLDAINGEGEQQKAILSGADLRYVHAPSATITKKDVGARCQSNVRRWFG